MEKMHKIAEIVFDQELEALPTYIEDNPPENNNQAIWYLGKSIQMMSEADFFIGIEYSDFYKGCSNENNIARDYGIRYTYVRIYDLMPDAVEVERRSWDERGKTCYPVL